MISFRKWEALGNDFLFILGEAPANAAVLAQRLCHRRLGVGADGLVFLTPEPRMILYNSDGSRALMCGNALRCIAGILAEPPQQWRVVHTDSGPRQVRTLSQHEFQVDMGTPQPLAGYEPVLALPEVGLPGHLLSMGNPHLVILCPEGLPADSDFERWGRAFQSSAEFPADGINVTFAARQGDGLELRTWERGAGPTDSCGTAACATTVTAVRVGWFEGPCRVRFHGSSQDLTIHWNNTVLMTGPAREVFTGQWPEEDHP